MNDPRKLRELRLKNEYEELMRLDKQSSIINITPLGNAPYDKYLIEFNIRTIVGPAPKYREKTMCTLTIPLNFPEQPPIMMANDTPYPWHINWFANGRWCFGHWTIEESLVNYIHRCARTLQFDPEIANPRSVANGDAMSFWDANKNNRRIIPCDTQALPLLDTAGKIVIKQKITIHTQEKPKINFKN